jgi:hypothetical protein
VVLVAAAVSLMLVGAGHLAATVDCRPLYVLVAFTAFVFGGALAVTAQAAWMFGSRLRTPVLLLAAAAVPLSAPVVLFWASR